MTAADYRRLRYAIGVLRAAGRRLPGSEQQTIAVACAAIERVFQGVDVTEEPRSVVFEPDEPEVVRPRHSP